MGRRPVSGSHPAGPGAKTASAAPRERYRIDELARRTGMTVRNIREHQSRGLLPPPQLRGRVGYYGPEHAARIELIREFQAHGFNLEAIRRLLQTTGGGHAELERFRHAVQATFQPEQPRVVDAGEVAAMFGGDPDALRRATALGLLRVRDDGRVEEQSPQLLRIGAELTAAGIPAAQALEAAGTARLHTEQIAVAFVRLYVDTVWRPFEAAGRPEQRLREITGALDRLRPLAVDAVLSLFRSALDQAANAALEAAEDGAGGEVGPHRPDGGPA